MEETTASKEVPKLALHSGHSLLPKISAGKKIRRSSLSSLSFAIVFKPLRPLKTFPHRADNRTPFYTGFDSNSFRSVMSKAILHAPTILPAESLTGEMDKDTFLFRLSFR